MKVLRSLYFRNRFFIASAILVAFFILSFPFNGLLALTSGLLFLLISITLTDLLFLFRNVNRLKAVRSTPEKLSNGDQNLISIYIENYYSFRISVSVIDEIPHQFQRRNVKFQAEIEPGETRIIEYNLRPVKRGNYSFGAVNIFVSSGIGLISRRYSFSQDQEVPVYPSFLQLRKYELHAISNQLVDVDPVTDLDGDPGQVGVGAVHRVP